MMINVGLTGGIGSGKTTVARILKTMGYPVYISDTRASVLMNTDPLIRQQLTEAFGNGIYQSEKLLDKQRLAGIIFRDKAALHQVNAIVHPRVTEDYKKWQIEQASDIVFFESAIIFESKLESLFDFIICVVAPIYEKIIRIKRRDNLTEEKVTERLNNQMSDVDKSKLCDFIIRNGNNDMIIKQIIDIIEQITSN